jgi:thiol-disulfide isomerase/thioredoxin
MKSLFLIAALFFTVSAYAQKVIHRFTVDKNSNIVDSTGKRLTLEQWHPLLMSHDYMLKPINLQNDADGFILVKVPKRLNAPAGAAPQMPLSKEEQLARMPKPAESNFFTTGEKIKPFMVHDINGNKFKLKDLEGKVVVLNFWFIGCPPCRRELPELNELALSYANDPDVVFIAICLDEKSDIKAFIKNNPLAYHIVDQGSMYSALYRLNLYPTNVVLDKEGKVRFHSTAYYPNNTYWIKKTIDESK